jgi:hypothetical protein
MSIISGATLRTMTSNPCRKVTEEAAQPWQPPLIAMKSVKAGAIIPH